LEARLDQSLQRCYHSSQNRRLANHLLRERDALFTFLNCPGLEATNWRAEHYFAEHYFNGKFLHEEISSQIEENPEPSTACLTQHHCHLASESHMTTH
jgi:hypothetical protein